MENLARKEKSFGTANGHDIFTIKIVSPAKHVMQHLEGLQNYFDRVDDRDDHEESKITNNDL